MQLMISWLIRGSRVDYFIGSLQSSSMGRGCFMTYRLVWDPDNFIIYGFLMFA
jgi:hypothetical protein